MAPGLIPPLLPTSGRTGSCVVRVGLSTCCVWDEVPSPECAGSGAETSAWAGDTRVGSALCSRPVAVGDRPGGTGEGFALQCGTAASQWAPRGDSPFPGWGGERDPRQQGRQRLEGPVTCKLGWEMKELGGLDVILGPLSSGCCWERLENGLGEASPVAGTAPLPPSWAARLRVCASGCETGTPVLTPSTCTRSQVLTWTPALCTSQH